MADLETRIARLEQIVQALAPPPAPLRKVFDEAGALQEIWGSSGLLFKRPADADPAEWKTRLHRALKAWQEYRRRPHAVPKPDKAKDAEAEQELREEAQSQGLTVEEYCAVLRLDAIEQLCGLA